MLYLPYAVATHALLFAQRRLKHLSLPGWLKKQIFSQGLEYYTKTLYSTETFNPQNDHFNVKSLLVSSDKVTGPLEFSAFDTH